MTARGIIPYANIPTVALLGAKAIGHRTLRRAPLATSALHRRWAELRVHDAGPAQTRMEPEEPLDRYPQGEAIE